MSEDRDRLSETQDPEQQNEDVESHRLFETQEPENTESDDDVEAHRLA